MHILAALGMLGAMIYFAGPGTFALILLVLLIGVFALGWAIEITGRKGRLAAATRMQELLSAHQDALARQRIALVRKDAYGHEVLTAWQKEMSQFADRVLAPITGERYHRGHAVFLAIDAAAKARSVEILTQLSFDASMSPREYEIYCAEVLRKSGWEANATQQSADQGADVIATKNGRRGVFQCKLFSSPVGNKAVQEAHAARSHYSADFAAVVSNAGYTLSARQLAATTGVLLVSHYDLPNL